MVEFGCLSKWRADPLAFAALPGKDTSKYLLEEVPLAVLPVPQMLPELLARRDPARADTPPSLLTLGDVDFDASPNPLSDPKKEDVHGWKRRRAGDALKWNRLPGTRSEILSIEDTFCKVVPEGKLTTLRDGQATETALRQLGGKHEYLHLATHGFFTPREVKSPLAPAAESTHVSSERIDKVTGFHPGLLSGIVLAGANKPAADGDDGVLTALEVSELDLSKVELAVLSACETGLGDVAGGEGVLGIQRAFQVAGARTTVTSLWEVDDNYWRKNLGSLEALREAQLWMLRDEHIRSMIFHDESSSKKNARTPPYYWAAFVLSGDWR